VAKFEPWPSEAEFRDAEAMLEWLRRHILATDRFDHHAIDDAIRTTKRLETERLKLYGSFEE